MKYLIMFLSIALLSACEPQEYFPDVNADRDADLFGTWQSVDQSSEDSSFYVFEQCSLSENPDSYGWDSGFTLCQEMCGAVGTAVSLL